MVLLETEHATATGGTGSWTIASAYGTGDLRGITGHGTGTGTVDASGIHSKLTGTITCTS